MALLRVLVLALLGVAACTGTASASSYLDGWSCEVELQHFRFYADPPGTGTAQCLRGGDVENPRTATVTLTITSWVADGDAPRCGDDTPWHATGQIQLTGLYSWPVTDGVTLDGHVGDAEATLHLDSGAAGAIVVHPDDGYLNWCLDKNDDGTAASGAFASTGYLNNAPAACVLDQVELSRQPDDYTNDLVDGSGYFGAYANNQEVLCKWGTLMASADFGWSGRYEQDACVFDKLDGTMTIALGPYRSQVHAYITPAGTEAVVLHAGGWRGILNLQPIDYARPAYIGGDSGCALYYYVSGLLLNTSV